MAGNRAYKADNHYSNYDTAYEPNSVGKRRPEWIKKPLGKGDNTVQRMAAFICTRTAPDSFKDSHQLYWNLWEQNKAVFMDWHKAHQLVFMAVLTKLHIRDGVRLHKPKNKKRQHEVQ